MLLNATTRRDVSGAIVGVIGVGQDITEMRRLMERETLLIQAQVESATVAVSAWSTGSQLGTCSQQQPVTSCRLQ